MNDRALHLISLRRSEEALVELQKSFDVEDPSDWWTRGLALFGLNRTGEALDAVHSGLAVDPESTMLLDLAARCHSHRDDLVAAEEAILAALRVDSEDPALFSLYALIVAKAGQLEKAKKLIAQARRLDPEDTQALRVEAAIATSRGDDREALLRSREILEIDPEDRYGHLMTGEVLHGRGDVHGAAEYLRNAVVSDPRDSAAAELARENRAWRHPLMWPLRPVHKFGGAKVWIAGIVLLLLARATKNSTVMLTVAIAWVVYCIYSWVVPPLVRRLVR